MHSNFLLWTSNRKLKTNVLLRCLRQIVRVRGQIWGKLERNSGPFRQKMVYYDIMMPRIPYFAVFSLSVPVYMLRDYLFTQLFNSWFWPTFANQTDTCHHVRVCATTPWSALRPSLCIILDNIPSGCSSPSPCCTLVDLCMSCSDWQCSCFYTVGEHIFI